MFLSGSLLLFACAGDSSKDCLADGTGASSCIDNLQQPGRSWQGRSFQGRSFQGRSFQGSTLAVSTVNQISLNGVQVDNVQLSGTVLHGSVNGQDISGTDFIGAVVIQNELDGTTSESTISNVAVDSQDAAGEILLYTLVTKNPITGQSENMCAPDPWGGQYATPVYGAWDVTGVHQESTTQFMFGCTSGVVAKCVRWGYKPWKSVAGQSLAEYHQICTRMATADYCGDGVSHTVDGTLIDMYDDLGIQVKAPFDLTSPLVFDAAWTTQGAYCVSKDRWLNLQSLATVDAACKAKFVNLFPLLATSPVDSSDLCLVKRTDIPRTSVHIDNRSGLNITLF